MSKQKHFVLLRGLTRESAHWGEFTEHLKVQYPNSKIFCLDLPGAGKFYQLKCPLSVSEMTDLLRNEVDKDFLNNKELIFIGVSLGGMVGLDWAKRFNQDFSSVILINTSLAKLSMPWKRLRPKTAKLLIRSIFSPSKREDILFSTICKNQQQKNELINLWKKIQEERPVSLVNAIRQILAASVFSVEAPVEAHGLIINSKEDEFVNEECSQKLAQYLNWEIKVHPWGGHELTDDDPQWVLEQIKSFITEERFEDLKAYSSL